MARLRLRDVRKRFGATEVVRGVDLDIADGELVVLVGPSGCGKSTTLRMIAGLEAISDGEILIGERRVNDVAPKDRDIAMVFQSYALYPHMSVRRNLEFGLRMRKLPRAEIDARVTEAAAMLGIDDLLDRRPGQMSGGQRQRVAMGRAVVRRPAVFLFDEPLSNLDAKLRARMRTELGRLHAKLATTTVYVTHDQVEAMTLADRIVVMNGGEVQQVGTPLELYETPANRFVASFIGTPTMNFIDGRREGIRFVAEGVDFALAQQALDALPGGVAALSLGVRPGDLALVAPDAPGTLAATVAVREPLGAEVYLHLDSPCGALVACVPGRSPLRAGDRVGIDLARATQHLFAADEDGVRIASVTGAADDGDGASNGGSDSDKGSGSDDASEVEAA